MLEGYGPLSQNILLPTLFLYCPNVTIFNIFSNKKAQCYRLLTGKRNGHGYLALLYTYVIPCHVNLLLLLS